MVDERFILWTHDPEKTVKPEELPKGWWRNLLAASNYYELGEENGDE